MSMPTIRCRVTPTAYRALEELADAPTPGAVRARIVLAVLAGAPPAALARQEGVPRTTVYSWVRRFAATGVAGLQRRPLPRDVVGDPRQGA